MTRQTLTIEKEARTIRVVGNASYVEGVYGIGSFLKKLGEAISAGIVPGIYGDDFVQDLKGFRFEMTISPEADAPALPASADPQVTPT